ncbi:uncharacterized protein B0I36DRAFT_358108 [Microdochium trichocladiopsis]|uniref:Uncharacterized protein n=1 Tax=Microdochium trichocladiopsis TaxID=1682393 RepID=A0A9P8YIZ7_9PEZI|nr:uncharacterized protein B0I36DRAFT_358108 [Microdochium trichocladiopsis]KAH7040867.1 hypothetical protein B0I36DRAFT_358108 [Microdochium trichocladiopsis]
MRSFQVLIVALMSILSLAVDTASATLGLGDIVSADGHTNDAAALHARAHVMARAKSNAMLFGVPVSRMNSITTADTVNASDPITSGAKVFASDASLNLGTIKSMDNLATAKPHPQDNDAAVNSLDPVEYDDPGYRVKCVQPDDPANDPDGATHEDYKEAFECWFYHRTRCFGGVLTSPDPTCQHDCSCQRNDLVSYHLDKKGNHGAGLSGVCVVLPVPEYSPKDGGCV